MKRFAIKVKTVQSKILMTRVFESLMTQQMQVSLDNKKYDINYIKIIKLFSQMTGNIK